MSEDDKVSETNAKADGIMNDRKLTLTVGGLGIALISLFLPWYNQQNFTLSEPTSPGLSGNGLIIAALVVIGVVAALNTLKLDAWIMRLVAMAASVVVLIIVVMDYPDSESLKLNFGFLVAAVGATSATVGSIWSYLKPSSPKVHEK